MRNMLHLVVTTVAVYLLAAPAIAHLLNPYQFVASINKYYILPVSFSPLLGLLLPFVHLSLAISLLRRRVEYVAFQLASVLLAIYGVAQLSTLLRGIKINCGCFGAGDDPIGATSITLAFLGSMLCFVGTRLSFRPPRHRA